MDYKEYKSLKHTMHQDYVKIINNRITPDIIEKYNYTGPVALPFDEPIQLTTIKVNTINKIFKKLHSLADYTDSLRFVFEKYKDYLIKLNPLFSQLTEENFRQMEHYLRIYMGFILYARNTIKSHYVTLHKVSMKHLPPINIKRNTAYLFIELHGGVLYEENQLMPYTVPEGVEIFRVMQSTFGSANLCTTDYSKRIYTSLARNIPSKAKDTRVNNRKLIIRNLKSMMPESKCVLSDIRKTIRNNNQSRKTFKDKCLKVHTKHFVGGDRMADKVLSVNFGENFGFNKILLMNKSYDDAINILDYLPIDSELIDDHIYYSLRQVIEFILPYANMIVLVDLSCSRSETHSFNKVFANVAAVEKASFTSPNFETSPLNKYTLDEARDAFLEFKTPFLMKYPEIRDELEAIEAEYIANYTEDVTDLMEYSRPYLIRISKLIK